jgi:hypothetical protein
MVVIAQSLADNHSVATPRFLTPAACPSPIRGLDLLDRLSSLDAPVLVVGGRQDAAATL